MRADDSLQAAIAVEELYAVIALIGDVQPIRRIERHRDRIHESARLCASLSDRQKMTPIG